MKLMNSNRKSSITILFTMTLLTGFISVAFMQSALAFSIDFSGLSGFNGNQGLDLLKGPKGDKGDKGDTGPPGAKSDEGDTEAAGAPCPHQNGLIEHMRSPNCLLQEPSGDLVIPTNHSPDAYPSLVWVP